MEELRYKNFNHVIRDRFKVFRGYTLTKEFEKYKNEIENLEVYDDDIWLTSYPKCGTTWTQEMVWCMCNNFDFETVKEVLDIRFPFIDFFLVTDLPDHDNKIAYVVQSVNLVKNMKRPRFIKSHLPWDLLPKQIRNFDRRPKIIHVARNPKDACVSFFHHSKIFHGYIGDMPTFAKIFMAGNYLWAPAIQNILSYWKLRNEQNVLFIKYEDMKKDLTLIIKEVAAFLKITITYDQIAKLLNHLSFENMKKNKFVNHEDLIKILNENKVCVNPEGAFIRKGIVGSHKTEMDSKTIAAFDKWIEEELKNTGLTL